MALGQGGAGFGNTCPGPWSRRARRQTLILTTVDRSTARAGALLDAAIIGVLVGRVVLTFGRP
jgi:hypothetical protein